MIIKFALKNIRHTIDHLPIFLLSVSFSIMVAFSFFMISMNERVQKDLINQLSDNIWGQAMSSLISIHYFIIFFIFLFILYANNFFMRQRKRDISVLLLAGFSKFRIALYFMAQIFIVGLICMISGIGLGFIFTRLIYMFLLKLMSLDIPPAIGWNSEATNALILWFALALALLFLNTIYHITRTKASFIVNEESRFKKIKEHLWLQIVLGLTSLSVLIFELIWWAFYLPANTRSDYYMADQADFGFVGLCASVIACYGLFKWTIPGVINLIKKMRLQNDVQLIWLNNLKRSMLQNSFVLTIITVTSIIALAIFSALSYAYPYRQREVQLNSPTQLSLTKRMVPEVKKVTERYDVGLNELGQTEVKVFVGKDGAESQAVSFIKLTDYNSFVERIFGKSSLSLAEGQAIYLLDVDNDAATGTALENIRTFLRHNTVVGGVKQLDPRGSSKFFPMGRYMYFSDALVVRDDYFAKIVGEYDYTILGFNLSGKLSPKFKRAMALLEQSNKLSTVSYLTKNKAGKYLVAKNYSDNFLSSKLEMNYQDQDNDRFKQLIGLAVFVLLFLGLLLILASGNLLLLKLQDTTFDNIHDFRIYHRLGGTRKELKKILRHQTSFFLFAPVVLAIIANLAFLPVMVGEFQVFNYTWPIVVFVVYGLLNGLFYYVAYRNFDTLIYTSVIDRKGES